VGWAHIVDADDAEGGGGIIALLRSQRQNTPTGDFKSLHFPNSDEDLSMDPIIVVLGTPLLTPPICPYLAPSKPPNHNYDGIHRAYYLPPPNIVFNDNNTSQL